MSEERRHSSGFRLLGLFLGSVSLWAIGFYASMRVLEGEPASPVLRGAMVAVGVLVFLPWMWVVMRIIQAQDEFERRVHFVALSIAFAATAVMLVTADLLQRAGFLDYLSLSSIWESMPVTWMLSLLFTKRYYQ